MDQRLSVALPVLPALVHAWVLRSEAAYHVEHSGAGWADLADLMRALSWGFAAFAVVLIGLAAARAGRVAAWVLVVALGPLAGYVAVLGFLRFADATDASSLGEPSPVLAAASLATALLLLAASAAAVVSLRRRVAQSRSA